MKKLTLACAFLLLPFISQAAEITAGFGVDFLLLNGQSIEKISEEGKKRIELEKGAYQLVARYEKTLKRGSQNMLFTSKPYVFELVVGDKNLELSVPVFRNETQATAFFRKPKWQLTELDTGKRQILKAEELLANGFAAYSDMEKAIANHNGQKDFTQTPQTTQIIQSEKATVTKQTNLEQLKFWYEKASNAEKKAFKRWMIEEDY